MTAVAHCSRRLLSRSPSAAALVLLPARPQVARACASLGAAASIPLSRNTNTRTPSSSAAPFSTSSSALAKNNSHFRPGRNTQAIRNKKKQISHGKAIAPGERKAYRKRIILSNNNALEVPGLQQLTSAHLLGTATTTTNTTSQSPEGAAIDPLAQFSASAIPPPCDGRIVTLPDPLIDQLRAAQAFKPTQNFALFRHPSLLVRAETTELISKIQAEVTEKKGTVRVVVDGKRIAGKSTLLMQAMSYAFLNNYLVFTVPEAQELTSGGMDYTVAPDTDPVQYIQPTATLRFLHLFIEANSALLDRLKTARSHDRLNNPIAAGSTLLELCQAAKEADNAWPVLQAVWSELTDPAPVGEDGTPLERAPILFTVDGLAHIMRHSAYRTPAFTHVHAHDLLLVRLFVEALGGATKFPHGAAILAATTRGNAPITPSVELALAQRLAEQANATRTADEEKEVPPVREPYGKLYDDRAEAALRTVEVLKLAGVSKPEARSLMEYWAASGVVRGTITEQEVAALWTLSSNGLVGEMERAALLSIKPAYK